MANELYIVFKWDDDSPEFMGVFDDRDVAISHCHNRLYSVCPCKLNEHVGEERTEWPGSFFPNNLVSEADG